MNLSDEFDIIEMFGLADRRVNVEGVRGIVVRIARKQKKNRTLFPRVPSP